MKGQCDCGGCQSNLEKVTPNDDGSCQGQGDETLDLAHVCGSSEVLTGEHKVSR